MEENNTPSHLIKSKDIYGQKHAPFFCINALLEHRKRFMHVGLLSSNVLYK